METRFITTLLILTALLSCGQKESVDDSAKVDKWFVARFFPLCDDSRGIFLDLKKLTKYGKYNPYDTVEVIKKDSVTISFDFITDCCLTFSGDADLRQDTLFLKYGFSSDTMNPCDCYCDYRMTYILDKKDKYWKAIKILNE